MLLAEAPRTPGGHIKYAALQDVLLGHGACCLSRAFCLRACCKHGRRGMPAPLPLQKGPAHNTCLCCLPRACPAAGPAALSLTPSGIITGRPAMPTSYSWPDGQGFDVTLRLRPDARPFTLPSAAMQKFAAKLGPLCRCVGDLFPLCASVYLRQAMHLVGSLTSAVGAQACVVRTRTRSACVTPVSFLGAFVLVPG